MNEYYSHQPRSLKPTLPFILTWYSTVGNCEIVMKDRRLVQRDYHKTIIGLWRFSHPIMCSACRHTSLALSAHLRHF